MYPETPRDCRKKYIRFKTCSEPMNTSEIRTTKKNLNEIEDGAKLHQNVPPGWYYESIRTNIIQRYWHNRRFYEVTKLIEPTHGRILDIGCADGMFTKVILDGTGASSVIGIDVLERTIEWAGKFWRNDSRIKFQVGDAHKLDFESESFDAVVALEVLEHVFHPDKVLSEIRRVLKNDGYAIILVPTDNLIFRILWFLWTHFRGKVWKETHIKTYRNDMLPALAEGAGFKIEKQKRFILGMLVVLKLRKA
jgi:2-polyprenyl-3-methyl-5-hydroxy-6-metoxy-1,4-benzoquinol methylase